MFSKRLEKVRKSTAIRVIDVLGCGYVVETIQWRGTLTPALSRREREKNTH
jgi:hypothetical protein